MRESEIEKYLVQRVKALGGEVRKVKWIGRRGAPDRLVMLPGFEVSLRDAELIAAAGDSHAVKWLRDVQQCIAAELPGSGCTIWVELKAPGKKPEPHQLREHKRMQAMGQYVEVVDSLEGVDALLGGLGHA